MGTLNVNFEALYNADRQARGLSTRSAIARAQRAGIRAIFEGQPSNRGSRSARESESVDSAFDRRIAAIHGLDNAARQQSNMLESSMDIRHEEFQARVSVFLGDDVPATTLNQIEALQAALHSLQADLYRRYEAGELEPQAYVEVFNTLLASTFSTCETILGIENFQRLFGAPPSELGGFIDRDAFLDAHKTREVFPAGDHTQPDVP